MRAARGARADAALGLVVAGLAVAYLLAYPRAIGHADESYILDPARRIVQGQAMYRDVFDCLTPGSFYLFALLFAVTGPSLTAARVLIALVNGASAWLLFRLGSAVGGRIEAALASMTFAVLCVPVWPFASPHWLSTCFALGVAWAVVGRAPVTIRRALAAGVLAGLAISVQQQRGVFILGWAGLAILLLAFETDAPGRVRRAITAAAATGASAAAVVLAVLGYAAWRASVADVVYAIWTFVRDNYGPFNVGTTKWAGYMVLSASFIAFTWHAVLRAAPVVLPVEAVRLALRRDWLRRPRDLRRPALLLLAGIMCLSIIYFPDAVHVSFILPFLMVPAVALVADVRRALAGRWRAMGTAAVALAEAALAVLLAVKGQSNLAHAWRDAPERFATAVGTLDGQAGERRLLEEIRAVAATVPHDDGGPVTLYSYPVDPWLYLALPANNPTRYSNLLRGYHSPRHFEEAIAEIRARRTPIIVALDPWAGADDPIRRLLDEDYVPARDLPPYRIYVRRGLS